MARKGREISKSGIYHVIMRGENGLFFKENDYNEFLNSMNNYFTSKDARLYAYSLDKNKIHIVFKYNLSISLILKPLCTSYARYINRTYKKSGKLFYDRFISNPVDDNDMLAEVISFVSNKPSKFSSLAEYETTPKLCNISDISKDIDINKIICPKIIIPYTDDYISMTDSELKKFFLFCFNKKSSKVSKNDLAKMLNIATKNSNISKNRIFKIFGYTSEYERKPKAVEVKSQKPKPQQKKQELSIWLL